MQSNSIDAVVTDPPYGLSREPDIAEVLTHWLAGDDYVHRGGGFMGKSWDSFVPGPTLWREVHRVLKPGGHALVFAGTRTADLMGISLRLAGFEIRDQVAWLYGQGFPKSLNVSQAIDKARDDSAEVRAVCRWLRDRIDGHPTASVRTLASIFGFHPRMVEHWAARDTDSQPTLPTLTQWDTLREVLRFGDDMDAEVLRLNLRKGEPGEAWLGRPVTGVVEEWKNRTAYAMTSRDGLRRDTAATDAARHWDGWGTALKPAHEPILIARKPLVGTVAANMQAHGTGALNIDACRIGNNGGGTSGETIHGPETSGGRWPANVVLDPDAAAVLDQQAPRTGSFLTPGKTHDGGHGTIYGNGAGLPPSPTAALDGIGGASRFFYVAKASTAERNAGLDGKNPHPTVKPAALMRWLVRLVTPPDGLILDPFAGSGTTGVAAAVEGFNAVLIERDADYVDIARQRIVRATQHPADHNPDRDGETADNLPPPTSTPTLFD